MEPDSEEWGVRGQARMGRTEQHFHPLIFSYHLEVHAISNRWAEPHIGIHWLQGAGLQAGP